MASVSRRSLISTLVSAASAAVAGAHPVFARQAQQPIGPPSTVTIPPRDFGPGAPPTSQIHRTAGSCTKDNPMLREDHRT
jgi:hypothetical protein